MVQTAMIIIKKVCKLSIVHKNSPHSSFSVVVFPFPKKYSIPPIINIMITAKITNVMVGFIFNLIHQDRIRIYFLKHLWASLFSKENLYHSGDIFDTPNKDAHLRLIHFNGCWEEIR